MRAIVVYESLCGNTHQIAESAARGIRNAQPSATVECLPVAAASSDGGLADLRERAGQWGASLTTAMSSAAGNTPRR